MWHTPSHLSSCFSKESNLVACASRSYKVLLSVFERRKADHNFFNKGLIIHCLPLIAEPMAALRSRVASKAAAFSRR